ncbi:hypothetical protein COY95_02785 [Candidatus Woesearchaeota archaeon CG_4_10_14_0_8_um_filter_47_5]|nr:MAG: hypothetical protein COY95_02785 [Candidatus Woesearchaeota archaeon CG_4_10_14_0_8_um_filter_47_5]
MPGQKSNTKPKTDAKRTSSNGEGGQPVVRVGVILFDRGNLILAQHCREGKEYWVLPGGHLMPGETLAACAVREVHEELNLMIQVSRLVYVTETAVGGKPRIDVVFHGHICGGRLLLGTDPEEKEGKEKRLRDVKEVTLAQFHDLLFYPPKLKRAILSDYPHGFSNPDVYVR